MARPAPRDNDALTAFLLKVKADLAALASRLTIPVGKRWRIEEDNGTGNLVAVIPATSEKVVLATPAGADPRCGQTLACIAEASDGTLAYDTESGAVGVHVSRDTGNGLSAGTDGGLFAGAGGGGLQIGMVTAIIDELYLNVMIDGVVHTDVPHLDSHNPFLWQYVLVATAMHPDGYEVRWVIGAIGAYTGGGGGGGGGANVFVQTTEPGSAVAGDLWIQANP